MLIERCIVGPLQANCYLLADSSSQQAVIIDPGDEVAVLSDMIAQAQAAVTAILCTHGHPDHIGAAVALAEVSNIDKIYLHPAEVEMLSELGVPEMTEHLGPRLQTYDEGDQLEVGKLAVRVIHTPGHSPGSVCLAVQQMLFTGDTLFDGGVGRTDLPGGSDSQLRASLQRIVKEFPPQTVIYPGHGPTSTLAAQRESNPWIAQLI